MKILFLDIDGVLNGCEFDELARSTRIESKQVEIFNRLLWEVPDLKIVLSSSWRYLILEGAMTTKGFESLLRTHGVACIDRLIDSTVSDEKVAQRGYQILEWLGRHPEVTSWAAIDDDDLDEMSRMLGDRFVRTQKMLGITDADVNRVIQALRK